MSEPYSGVLPEPDGTFSIWWRHSDQRPAQYLKGMTLEEVRCLGLALVISADTFEDSDQVQE